MIPIVRLGACGLSIRSRVGIGQVLHLALLAVLFVLWSAPFTLPLYPFSTMTSTHLPLGEPQFALAPLLSGNALLLFQRATHDARCDRDVTVVAVGNQQLLRNWRARSEQGAYEIPAAFHANAIVMVGWVWMWEVG